MNGLQIDLVLLMLGAFAFGLRIGRGQIVQADVMVSLATGIGLLLVQTNLLAALQIVGVQVGGLLLMLGRFLSFGGAIALFLLASRRRSPSR